MSPPGIEDASRFGSGVSTPVILLNAETGKEKTNGFSWRIGEDRLEIYGSSERGLCSGVFDFLAALGMRWPRPDEAPLSPARRSRTRPAGMPVTPPALDRVRPWEYPLREGKRLRPALDRIPEGPRLFLDPALSSRDREAWILWAARNRIDRVVFPLSDESGFLSRLTENRSSSRDNLYALAESYALILEAGGWDLSLLVPRRYFCRNPELFRMEQGKRIGKINFCATNPDTLTIVKNESARLFRKYPETGVFHLWPDRGNERVWCACPSCRAFSPEEQNRIAVNCAADVLAELNPAARISYYESTDGQADILTRPNMFRLTKLPDEDGAEAEGLFWASAPSRQAPSGP
jgi:hypothetical protein